jgi:hypothetical protein
MCLHVVFADNVVSGQIKAGIRPLARRTSERVVREPDKYFDVLGRCCLARFAFVTHRTCLSVLYGSQ